MSERPDDQAPDLDPADEERVRRLLADAAAAEPLPSDVAGRLDDTLAALVAERRATGTSDSASDAAPGADPESDPGSTADSTRLPLQARRARRRWPTILVAAAAVCLIALGAGDLVRSGGGGGASTSGGQAASEARAGAAGSAADGLPDDTDTVVATPPLPRLHSATLEADVARAARRHDDARAPALAGPAAVRCAGPPHSRRDRVLLVRLDGQAASLVLGPAADGHRVARLYRCADPAAPLATVTVPTR